MSLPTKFINTVSYVAKLESDLEVMEKSNFSSTISWC